MTNPSTLTRIATLLTMTLVAAVFIDNINAFDNFSFTGEQRKCAHK